MVAATPLSVEDAKTLLLQLGAPARLLQHVRLVGEAGEVLLSKLADMGVPLDTAVVRLGIVFHDAGKVAHPNELDAPGDLHEPAGEKLLLEHGVAPCVARCCVSHARWASMECSLEELLVALADKLWKGVRVAELERVVVERVAKTLGRPTWDVFVELDTCFEEIASEGDDRLARSR